MPCAVNPLRPLELASATLAQHGVGGWLCPHVSCVVLGDFPLQMKGEKCAGCSGLSCHSSQGAAAVVSEEPTAEMTVPTAVWMELRLFRPIYFGI